MSEVTWFCAECGSLDIRHDAIVQWKPDDETWEVLDVLDGTWCEACMDRNPSDEGAPTYGIPGVTTDNE